MKGRQGGTPPALWVRKRATRKKAYTHTEREASSAAKLSPQSENVRFVQSRNVRFHGWLGATWKRSALP